MPRKNIIIGFFSLVLTVGLLTGCQSDDTINSLTGAEPGQAAMSKQSADNPSNGPAAMIMPKVMAIHASPNAPAVDLLVNNKVAGTGLGYPNNTPYLTTRPGKNNFKINVAGTNVTVIDASLVLSPRTAYSVFATDSVSRISPLVLVDDLTPPAPAKAHVRFVHLSPNAPAVDVAVQGGPVVFGNKAFREATDFTPLDAGTYNLEVRLANTITVVLSLPNITLQEGTIYTVFAKGFVGGTGGQALGAQIIVNN